MERYVAIIYELSERHVWRYGRILNMTMSFFDIAGVTMYIGNKAYKEDQKPNKCFVINGY